MIVYDDLYLSDSLVNDKKSIINKLRHAKLLRPDIFVIYINDNTERPEVMQGFFFNQIYFQVKRVRILGITSSREEAVRYMAEQTISLYGATLEDEEN